MLVLIFECNGIKKRLKHKLVKTMAFLRIEKER